MIKELIKAKSESGVIASIGAGLALYLLNLLLAIDFLLASLLGGDPRLSVSALLGIRLYHNPHHAVLSKLPESLKDHFLYSASWWAYEYPSINRSIWT
jgi:hypothetical protein